MNEGNQASYHFFDGCCNDPFRNSLQQRSFACTQRWNNFDTDRIPPLRYIDNDAVQYGTVCGP